MVVNNNLVKLLVYAHFHSTTKAEIPTEIEVTFN